MQNNSYIVIARKYRPTSFKQIIGQDNTVEIIQSGIENNRLGHAFIFTGIRGTGKTTFARILARAFNCESNDQKPCNKCESCINSLEGKHIDIIEIDAASNTGVEDIRQIINTVQYKASYKYKVFIIDEIHMLSKGAFNALLKTLEEPPSHVKFIFATTEIHKVPSTILSRCLKFQLNLVSISDLLKNMKNICDLEGVKYDSNALEIIAENSSGSVRDSLSILEQAILLGSGNIVNSLVKKMLSIFDQAKIEDAFNIIFNKKFEKINEVLDSGDVKSLLQQVNSIIYQSIENKLGIKDIESLPESIISLLKNAELNQLLNIYQIINNAINELTYSYNQIVSAKITLIKSAIFFNDISLDKVIKNLSKPITNTSDVKDLISTVNDKSLRDDLASLI